MYIPDVNVSVTKTLSDMRKDLKMTTTTTTAPSHVDAVCLLGLFAATGCVQKIQRKNKILCMNKM